MIACLALATIVARCKVACSMSHHYIEEQLALFLTGLPLGA